MLDLLNESEIQMVSKKQPFQVVYPESNWGHRLSDSKIFPKKFDITQSVTDMEKDGLVFSKKYQPEHRKVSKISRHSTPIHVHNFRKDHAADVMENMAQDRHHRNTSLISCLKSSDPNFDGSG